MLLSLISFAVCWLLRALAPSAGDDLARDVELLVVRHQLRVLGPAKASSCAPSR